MVRRPSGAGRVLRLATHGSCIARDPRAQAPWLLAVARNVSKSPAPQTSLGELAGCHPMREGEAIEAFADKICWDAPRWSTSHRLASACWPSWLSRGGRRSRLLPVEDLPPPIGVGGGDPSMAPEALVCRDAALHWPSQHAAQQLWARPTVFPPPLPSTLETRRRTATARRQRLSAWQGHHRQRRRPRWLRLLTNRVQVGGHGGGLHLFRIRVVEGVVVRPTTGLGPK